MLSNGSVSYTNCNTTIEKVLPPCNGINFFFQALTNMRITMS